MYNIRKAIINPFQCKCDDYSGCCLPNGIRDCCDVCFLFTKHNPSDNENDFKIKNIIRKNIELVNDMENTILILIQAIIILLLSIEKYILSGLVFFIQK